MTYSDISYPQPLKMIHDAPMILYSKGKVFPQNCSFIGIVGSRNATHYGLETAEKFAQGLSGLEGFSHIWLIYHFHKSEGFNLQVVPFLDDKKHGLFATRVPRRPNQIGISVVKLLSINNNILEIENVDIVDGTPLLDIKPYIPAFDCYDTERNGWIGDKNTDLNKIRSDNRFD